MSAPSREDRIAALINFEKADEKAKSLKLKKIKQFGYKNPSIFKHMNIEEWTERSLVCWRAQAGCVKDFINKKICLPCEGSQKLEQIKTFIFTDEKYYIQEEGYFSCIYYRGNKLSFEGYKAELFGLESMIHFAKNKKCCIFVKAGTEEFEQHPIFLLGIDLVSWMYPDKPEGEEGVLCDPPAGPFESGFCGAEFFLGNSYNCDYWPLGELYTPTYNISGWKHAIRKIERGDAADIPKARRAAQKFIDDYVDTTFPDQWAVIEWVNKRQDVSPIYKELLSKLYLDALKGEPECGYLEDAILSTVENEGTIYIVDDHNIYSRENIRFLVAALAPTGKQQQLEIVMMNGGCRWLVQSFGKGRTRFW
jgi:hypothetical protein